MTPTCTEEVASQESNHTTVGVDTCGRSVEYEQDNGKINDIYLVLNKHDVLDWLDLIGFLSNKSHRNDF